MRNLLITTVGKDNLSEIWTRGDCNFDVILIDYEKEGVFKYPGIYDRIISDELFGYDYYWMPDEDVELPSEDINRMFDVAHDYSIDLSQPSILNAHDSFPSWDRFVHRKGSDLEATDFIEVMCPLFSKDAMMLCLNTFPKSKSGWGLDLAWSKLLTDDGMSMVILNCIQAKHRRKVGAGKLYYTLKKMGILPSQERKALMREFGITNHSILK